MIASSNKLFLHIYRELPLAYFQNLHVEILKKHVLCSCSLINVYHVSLCWIT